jgi:hypothetical protein
MSTTLSKQAGVTAIEFAQVCGVFYRAAQRGRFNRLLWAWNAATEAPTRARLAWSATDI